MRFSSLALGVAIAVAASMSRPVSASAAERGDDGRAHPSQEQKKSGKRANGGKGERPHRWHTVYEGQRLGSIAKRYNVSIAALCHANDISRRDPIHPGQRLIVPHRHDKDGSEARRARLAPSEDERVAKAKDAPDAESPAESDAKSPAEPDAAPPSDPGTPDEEASAERKAEKNEGSAAESEDARARRSPGGEAGEREGAAKPDVAPSADGSAPQQEDDPPAGSAAVTTPEMPSWTPYLAEPARKGMVSLVGRKGATWKGTVMRNGKVLPAARKAFARAFAAGDGSEVEVDAELIAFLVRLSDAFGGRTLRVVSGYRNSESAKTSKHREGAAVDFTIDGVPLEPLRDYLKSLDGVGVGYYPNSGFVHVDLRDQWTYWVDVSARGEPPRYEGFWVRVNGREVKAR